MTHPHEAWADLRARLALGAEEVPMPPATFAARLAVVRVIGRPLVRRVFGVDLRDFDDGFMRHEGDVSDLGSRRAVGVAIPVGDGAVDRSFDEALARLAEVRCRQQDESLYCGPMGEYLVTRVEHLRDEPTFDGDDRPDGRTSDLTVKATLATTLSFGFELPLGEVRLPHALSAAGICYATDGDTAKVGVHRSVRARRVRADALWAFAALAEEELAASLEALPVGIRDLLKGQQPSASVSTYWSHRFAAVADRPKPGARTEPSTEPPDLWTDPAAQEGSEDLRRVLRDPRSRPEVCRAARIELAARREPE